MILYTVRRTKPPTPYIASPKQPPIKKWFKTKANTPMTTFKIAVQIGAAITGGFTSAVRGSTAQLGQLGRSLDTLKRQQAAVGKVELGEASVGKARVAYNAAVGDVVRLRREMAQTGPPTKQLAQSFDAAKQKAAQRGIKVG